MPANGRRDLIRRLKFKTFFFRSIPPAFTMHLQHFVNNAVLSHGITIEENAEIECFL